MISASEAWKTAQNELLAPEGFVEISYYITEDGLQDMATASAEDEAIISNMSKVLSEVGVTATADNGVIATNEHNLWALDGSMSIHQNMYLDNSISGYVSEELDSGKLIVELSEVQTASIPGVTIQFSKEHDECAEEFTVTAYNGASVVATKTITGNTDRLCVVEMEISGFNKLEIAINKWSLPGHRGRIERIALGVIVVFSKNDILSYSHEQTGCMCSGELPKNSIEFSLDNTSGRWNIGNPSGYEKYIAERQRLKVRYGFNVNGTTEWINAGQFYLSEWRTPANGMEASFVARDILEFLLDEPYMNLPGGVDTLKELANTAATEAMSRVEASGAYVSVWDGIGEYSVPDAAGYTLAEVLQMCANAGCGVMIPDDQGRLLIQAVPTDTEAVYKIPLGLSYTYPEYELSKPLRGVQVKYGEAQYNLSVGTAGETQTIENPFITTAEQAAAVAEWTKKTLVSRKKVSGNFRADPRLMLYDVVTVEMKDHVEERVILTSIRYTFTGAFRAEYSGFVPEVET